MSMRFLDTLWGYDLGVGLVDEQDRVLWVPRMFIHDERMQLYKSIEQMKRAVDAAQSTGTWGVQGCFPGELPEYRVFG